MCESAQCLVCGKSTWTGCGDHVREVFRGVRRRDRCQGHGGMSGIAEELSLP